MAHDLTGTLAKFLDGHLVLPLLEFLQSTKLYNDDDLQRAKFQILEKTNMLDLAIEIHGKLYADKPQAKDALLQKRAKVVARLKELQDKTQGISTIFASEDVQKLLEDGGEPEAALELLVEHGFKLEDLPLMYEHARFLFDCGSYALAEEWLYNFALFSSDQQKKFSAMWGKFASEILLQKWPEALADLRALQELIDPKHGPAPGTPVQQLQQRTWVIHWSLFVFFNHPEGRDQLVDLFLNTPVYANAIQTTCPHILRYLAGAIITGKRRRGAMNELVKIIQQESYTYRDPITEFVECLFVHFDFDGAQKKLKECEVVLANDMFLASTKNEFVDNARLFIFETYCRIHSTVSIDMLAEKLNMDANTAELWIVNLIRNAKLDAKLDSAAGNIVMAPRVPSVYQQVIDKTNSLSVRTAALTEGIDKKLAALAAARRTYEFN